MAFRFYTAALTLTVVASAIAAGDPLFVRWSDDGTRTEIGSNATERGEARAIRFKLSQSEVQQWPEPVTIAIKDTKSDSAWSVTLTAPLSIKPHTLIAPVGTYRLTFTAKHFKTLTRDVNLGKTDADLGTLTVTRYPLITGSVRTANGSPVIGAFVGDAKRHSAKTDTLGTFALEIEGEWPGLIEVSYPGLTTKLIAVPKAQISTRLPPITLFRGSQVALNIEGMRADLEAELAVETGYKRVKVLTTVAVHENEPTASFEDLDDGHYVVIVRGNGPLQRLATSIMVGEAESLRKTIRIDPLAVRIDVVHGDSPAGGAFVTVQSDDNQWSSELQADFDGQVTAEAWQRGPFLFAVRLNEASSPVLLLESIEGKSEATVHLEVPDSRITGLVIDADDDTSPVPGATINVESANDDKTGGTVSTLSGADGKFVIDGLRHGSHALTVEAESYVRSEPTTIRLDQALARRDVTLRISRGISRELRVTNRNGVPIRGGMVIATVAGLVTGLFNTDESGHVTIGAPPGSGPVIFVVPLEGSFAVARLQSKTSKNDETIIVPDGTASLELRARDSSGKPIPQLQFLMRYDGELIPPDVADLLMIRRGITPMTGRDGVARIERLPTGFLELWPVRGPQELHDVMAGGPPSAPVQVSLKDGLNVASMTFERKH